MYFDIGLVFLFISGMSTFYVRNIAIKLQSYTEDAKELKGTKIKEMNIYLKSRKYMKVLKEEGINDNKINNYVNKYRWGNRISYSALAIGFALIFYHYTLIRVL